MAAPTHAEVRAESCSYCQAAPGESCTEYAGSTRKIRAHHTKRHYAALSRIRGIEAQAAEVAREELRAKIADIVSEYAIFADDGDKAAERIMQLIKEAGK